MVLNLELLRIFTMTANKKINYRTEAKHPKLFGKHVSLRDKVNKVAVTETSLITSKLSTY